MFSAVIFVRAKIMVGNPCPETNFVFVFGKPRVAPLKSSVLPNREIIVSLQGSGRKESQMAKTLDVSRIFMWVDSIIVLQMFHSLESQPVIVAHRVVVISDLPTDLPTYSADTGTSGFSVSALADSN